MEGVDEDSPPRSPQYEELLEMVTRTVAKLNINWPVEKQAEPQKSKVDECFLFLLSTICFVCFFSHIT